MKTLIVMALASLSLQALASAPRVSYATHATSAILCAQVVGTLYNPTTKECAWYKDSCQANQLMSQGFTVETNSCDPVAE